MPHVEVLPNSASVAAPGWTYVVDNGFDPSKVAINPKDRKRAAAARPGPRGENELSARQQTAIARRIAELERDNDPKQSIPVPGKSSVPKTQNARRIIQYQRQIKHWLDDEIAQLQQPPPPPSRAAVAVNRAAAPSHLRRASAVTGIPSAPSEAPPGPIPSGIATPALSMSVRVEPMSQTDAILSIDSSIPAPLRPAELEALLSALPLSYAASYAVAPAQNGPPQRQFCDNCGYWGKIKCLKCGARICGLECKDAHEATRCLKWA